MSLNKNKDQEWQNVNVQGVRGEVINKQQTGKSDMHLNHLVSKSQVGGLALPIHVYPAVHGLHLE